MATPILQATPPNFDFRPNIIPPSAGDLEEARIRRLMDTAKLRNLNLEPLQQQRMYELQKAGLSETTGYHQAQIADMATGRNLEARGQDVQMRGQNLTMDAHKEALKSSTENNILAHAISRPDIPLSVYAETAKQFGFPELGNALSMHHDEMQTEKAKQLGTALKTAASSGDTKTYSELLNTYKAMPDFQELAPKIKATIPEYAKDLDPTKPGVQTTTATNSYANDPEFRALNTQYEPQAKAERLRQEQATRNAALAARSIALQRRRNELAGRTPGYGRSLEGVK